MRIISQDNNLDFPYENIAISIGFRGDKKEFYVYAHMINCYEMGKRPQKLATYSTEEKAQKAMEMLREKYAHMKRVECFSSLFASDHLNTLSDKEVKMLGDETQKLMCFQFPQDEDVEV